MTRKEALVNYLRSCVEAGDWHGVCDAANDLRVAEASQSAPVRLSLLVPPDRLIVNVNLPFRYEGDVNVRLSSLALQALLRDGWRVL